MKLPYREGTWFAVPLRDGGFGVGVVARMSPEGKIILCYFFGPRRTSVPSLKEVESLDPAGAIRVIRIGDLSLIRAEWPIIGNSPLWNRSDWTMPPFARRDDVSGTAWRVQYSDSDPNAIDREIAEPYESSLERDSVFGAGAVELLMTRLLK
jgi:hypothetical protein